MMRMTTATATTDTAAALGVAAAHQSHEQQRAVLVLTAGATAAVRALWSHDGPVWGPVMPARQLTFLQFQPPLPNSPCFLLFNWRVTPVHLTSIGFYSIGFYD